MGMINYIYWYIPSPTFPPCNPSNCSLIMASLIFPPPPLLRFKKLYCISHVWESFVSTVQVSWHEYFLTHDFRCLGHKHSILCKKGWNFLILDVLTTFYKLLHCIQCNSYLFFECLESVLKTNLLWVIFGNIGLVCVLAFHAGGQVRVLAKDLQMAAQSEYKKLGQTHASICVQCVSLWWIYSYPAQKASILT